MKKLKKVRNLFTGDINKNKEKTNAEKYQTKKGDIMSADQMIKQDKINQKNIRYKKDKEMFKVDGKPKQSELNKYMTKYGV